MGQSKNETKSKKPKSNKPKQPLKTSYITWLMTIRKDVLMLFLRILSSQLEKEGQTEIRQRVTMIVQKRGGHISNHKVDIVKEVRECVGPLQWNKAINTMKIRLSGGDSTAIGGGLSQ